MLEKYKNFHKSPIWGQFRDIRFIGFVVFGIMVLLASWSGVNVIQTNYELQKQIAQLDQQNQVSQLQNNNLKLQNEYYNTDTYLELTARKQLGRGAPGEMLILVPRDVALKYAKQLSDTKPSQSNVQPEQEKPTYRRNFDDWMNFLFRRSS